MDAVNKKDANGDFFLPDMVKYEYDKRKLAGTFQSGTIEERYFFLLLI